VIRGKPYVSLGRQRHHRGHDNVVRSNVNSAPTPLNVDGLLLWQSDLFGGLTAVLAQPRLATEFSRIEAAATLIETYR